MEVTAAPAHWPHSDKAWLEVWKHAKAAAGNSSSSWLRMHAHRLTATAAIDAHTCQQRLV
jgi:hypothetical protein